MSLSQVLVVLMWLTALFAVTSKSLADNVCVCSTEAAFDVELKQLYSSGNHEQALQLIKGRNPTSIACSASVQKLKAIHYVMI